MKLQAVVFSISVLFAFSFAVGQSLPPGGGGGGPTQGGWQVLPVVQSGMNIYHGFVYGVNGTAKPTLESLHWGSVMLDHARNDTHHNLTARMVSEGTIKIGIKWIGQGPAPEKVWIKASSTAFFDVGLQTFSPGAGPPVYVAAGSCNNGLGDSSTPTPTGGVSTGEEYFLLNVNLNGVAEKTITISAESSVTGPFSTALTGFFSASITPDPFIFSPSEMTFVNTTGPIDTENTTFFATSGQTFPVQGWRTTVGGGQEAFPVHFVKASQPSAKLTYLAKVNWLEPTPPVEFKLGGSMSYSPGVFISWPDAAGQASASVQNKTFTSANPLLDKIHSFAYMPDWVIKPQQPFPVQSKVTGTNTVFVTWGPPIQEIVTLKRLSWAVNAVSSQPVQENIPGEENAADRIWQAIPVRFGRTIVEGEEWRLLDPDPYYKGECDEHARLMVKAMHILGIPAAPSKIYASTDSDVEAPEMRIIGGEIRWLVMDFNTEPIPTWVGADWNAFEGVCKTAGRVYSIAPRHKGLNVRDFFNTLGFEQYWCKTRFNLAPGDLRYGGWGPPEIPPTPIPEPKPTLTN